MVSKRGLFQLFSTVVTLNTCTALNPLKVNMTVGTVYGVTEDTAPHVAQFLGIPFAEPPIGDLRWLPPVTKTPVGSIEAKALGPSCPQYESAIANLYSVDGRGFLISGPTSEDCLTLNIWKPLGNYSANLPVLVWIYGGGFQTGGGEVPYQIPTNWIERTQSHIVVGINYRLNIFGFPNAAGLNQSDLNLGLLDQRLALEWVRSNIAFFGGDTSRITLWGQSAGAESTDYYNFAYPDDPIISGIILDSGTALLPSGTYDPEHTNFTFVASQFGCGGLSADDELSCMRNVRSVDIEAFLKSYGDNGTAPSVSFNPVDDERTKFSNYTARALAGNFTRVPAIIGTNADEGTSLVTWDPSGDNVTIANAVTLSTFLCPAVQTTNDRYAANTTTFRYLYSGNFSNISPRPWEGAYHSSDLPLHFGTTDLYGPSTPFELAVSYRMQDLWLAFNKDPVNGMVAEGWAPYYPGGIAVTFAPEGNQGVVMGTLGIATLDMPCSG